MFYSTSPSSVYWMKQIQNNDTQHDDSQQNDYKNNNKMCSAECHNLSFMSGVVVLNVVAPLGTN